jgi:hypothetical protein
VEPEPEFQLVFSVGRAVFQTSTIFAVQDAVQVS